MESFGSYVNAFNNLVWSDALVYLCLITGVYFTVRMKFPQIRLIKDMVRLLIGKGSQSGISSFQAFATTVGSRVGMGNIASVSTAIYFGGPGAIFWMWLISILGAASAFAESSLAQAYKVKVNNQYAGGAAYFSEQGLHLKPLSILFAIATILGPGILMPGVQVQSIALSFDMAFQVNDIVVGVLCTVLVAMVICGGIKRISVVAELLAPVMCVAYILITLYIFAVNIDKVPGVFALIFRSAFGMEQAFAGIVGAAISWGVKRGVYSNEAGQGSGAIVAAAAECDHPAEQGLVQAFSVFVDTLVICTASALIIILTNSYNVVDLQEKAIVEHIPGVAYGILWAQTALVRAVGSWSGQFLAVIIVLFVFTSLMGYYYQAESNVTYLSSGNPKAIWAFRVAFLISCFAGVLIENKVVWSMGDTGCGLMAWFNIIAILLLSSKACAILKDYEEQKRSGVKPLFDPKKFNVPDVSSVWADVARKRS